MNCETVNKAPVHMWIADSLSSEARDNIDRLAKTEGVFHIAIMPDVHLANEVCVGSVIATEGIILPGAIGGDIGCGMAAIGFNGDSSVLSDKNAATQVMSQLYARIPAIRHSRRFVPIIPQNCDRPLSFADGTRMLDKDGRLEFATLGSGNHFLEFQAGEDGRLWIMVHTGSRAMGQAIAAHHLKNTIKTSTGFKYLDADSDEGKEFLMDMEWAVAYAKASRRAIIFACVEIMKRLFGLASDATTILDCVHNFLGREDVSGRQVWVHRKGAISVRDGEIGVVPGSMGTPSFHVTGRNCEAALFSSAHGAGRCRSRSEARRSISDRQFLKSMQGIWFDHRRAQQLLDEAPGAYKDIIAVMRAQNDLVRTERKLRPILNFKGAA
ncbi:MAG: RtcB family protein [Candidatus Riflebacteria bacterium]|nr:RtcB family protein [Candidatus Riflebacteria bacterium]